LKLGQTKRAPLIVSLFAAMICQQSRCASTRLAQCQNACISDHHVSSAFSMAAQS
jgi:hypothetical protein